MKFWVTQDRLVVDTATADLRGGLQDAAEGTVTASAGSLSSTTSPEADGSWRVSVPLEIGVNEITVTATAGAGLTSTWTGTVIRLITDRVKADLDSINAILRRFAAGTQTEADWTALNAPSQRGAYNDSDLNRVIAAANLVYRSLVDQGIAVDYVPMDGDTQPDGHLPEGYTELEYIESSGTQYIDTGFRPNNNTSVFMQGQMQAEDNPQFLFGCRTAQNTVNFSVLVSGSSFRSDYGESKIAVSGVSITDPFVINKSKNICTINENSVMNASSVFQSAYNLFIFASNDGGEASYFGKLRLEMLQLRDGENLVRWYIPCRSPSGAVGLYDTVGQQFYANAGGGTFIAGPDVPAPPPIDEGPWAEANIPTESQMVQYLDNVANLLSARLVQAQHVTLPESMASLTLAGANNIEWALVCVDAVTPVVRKSYIYSGEAMAGEF